MFQDYLAFFDLLYYFLLLLYFDKNCEKQDVFLFLWEKVMLGSFAIAMIAMLVFIIFWSISTYNKLVRLDALSVEGWSGIDVQLKRRILGDTEMESVRQIQKDKYGNSTWTFQNP